MYGILQHYWWFLISLLGALLVFLMFVQGGNSLLFSIGRTEEERKLLIGSTGRKWELTFTTLVTFGGAFFASFPLFYSTSFGGAYWLWMIILFSFVLQAVSYEFQNSIGRFLGAKPFRWCLVANGILGPLLIGGAVATFFNGSNFVISKDNLMDGVMPVISSWSNASHGLDALLDIWNLALGLAVLFLSRILGILYFMNNVNDEDIRCRCSVQLIGNTVIFLVFFLSFFVHLLIKDGYAYGADGMIVMERGKYMHNLLDMWYVTAIFVVGVALLLYGIVRTIRSKTYIRGIWPAGIGTVFAVLALLLCAGWNGTAYYPSNADLQSSLTIANSCSSEFTLTAMSVVSILIPFVVAYIAYAWRAIDKK